MLRYIALLLTITLIFTGCTQKKEQEHNLKISTNSWIGYTPLFYAHETGELEKLGFDLIFNVSLAEAAEIFDMGKADLVSTTQHEYNTLKTNIKEIVPIILIDRSNGGDMILANKPLNQLKSAKTLDLYLETDSINVELAKYFLKKNNIPIEKVNFFNQDQLKIQNVENDKTKNIVIVTYIPYDIALKKKGFFEIASTKNIHDLIVIDALCTKDSLLTRYSDKFKALKHLIDKSIKIIQNNPKETYKYTKKYLDNITYKEYLHSLKMIEWINNPSQELLKEIEPLGYKEDKLIR